MGQQWTCCCTNSQGNAVVVGSHCDLGEPASTHGAVFALDDPLSPDQGGEASEWHLGGLSTSEAVTHSSMQMESCSSPSQPRRVPIRRPCGGLCHFVAASCEDQNEACGIGYRRDLAESPPVADELTMQLASLTSGDDILRLFQSPGDAADSEWNRPAFVDDLRRHATKLELRLVPIEGVPSGADAAAVATAVAVAERDGHW